MHSLFLNSKINKMKFNILILLLLGLGLVSCKDDMIQENTAAELIEFEPYEAEPNILDEYPEGLISFKLNDAEEQTVERASVFASSKETLIISEYIDPVTNSPTKIIIGAKGFSKGTYPGNVFGFGTVPTTFDLANITFTEYGNIDELVSGSFSVEYEVQGSSTTVTGNFSGLRIN